MNERIFELAEQAYEETYRAMGSTYLQEAFDDFYTEKFAELIVGKCLEICKEKEQANLYGVREVEVTIKQHFGVE